MKKIILFLFITTIFIGCNTPKEYVTLSGKIDNIETKELTIASQKFSKKIAVNDDGTFKDTLKVEKGIYTMTNGQNKSPLFLANGYDLKINTDAKDFSNIIFSGKGEDSNNYILERIKFSKTDLFNPKSYFSLEKPEFDAKVEAFQKASVAIPQNDVDSLLIAQIGNDDTRFLDYVNKNYQAKYNAAVKFAKGKPSPKFTDFENYKGGTTSLDDLKGKFVYIDVWATWCGPCKQQIPFLKKIEDQYHGKNIEFVSISTDRKNKYDTWKKMIVDRQMGGIQLYAGNNNTFSRDYQINSIPRFILVDPEGNIVDADAPRPSDPKLIELFNSLNI